MADTSPFKGGKKLYYIKYSEGETLAEKTKSYLIGIGVSEEDINTLIEMMK